MNRCKYIGLSIILILLLALGLFAPKAVFASSQQQEPTPPTLVEELRVDTDIESQILYGRLKDIYNTYYGLTGTDKIDVVYANMFEGMDFAVFGGVLDLSSRGNSISGITSLVGLEKIDFSSCKNLTKLKVKNNSITMISAQDLSSLKGVREVDVSGNNITSLNLSELTNLEVLDASDNNLATIDLSFMKAEHRDAVVNLTGNKITDVNKVHFRRPAELTHNINLYIANSLTTYEYVGNNKVIVEAGLVGIKSGKYSKSDPLVYKKINNLQALGITSADIQLVIKDYDNTVVKYAVRNSEVSDGVNITEVLKYGKYMLYFTDADGNDVSTKCGAFVNQYNSIVIDLVPDAPSLTVMFGDKSVDIRSGVATKEDVLVVLSTSIPDATIMYRVDDGEWVEGTNIDIPAGKKMSIEYKVVVDGCESSVEVFRFAEDNSFGIRDVLGIILIIGAFLGLIFGLLPLVRYFINKPISVRSNKNDKKDD